MSEQGSQNQHLGVISLQHEGNSGITQYNDSCNTEHQDLVIVHPQQDSLPVIKVPVNQPKKLYSKITFEDGQLSFIPVLDRESVMRFINESGFLTYVVRSVKINSCLKSWFSLAGLLTQNLIDPNANDEVKDEVTDLIREYIIGLHKNEKYDDLVK